MLVSNVNVAFDLVWSGLVAFLIMVVFDLLLLHYLEISNYLYFNYFKEKAEQVEYAKKKQWVDETSFLGRTSLYFDFLLRHVKFLDISIVMCLLFNVMSTVLILKRRSSGRVYLCIHYFISRHLLSGWIMINII